MILGIEVRDSSVVAIAADRDGGARVREVRDRAAGDVAVDAARALARGRAIEALGLAVDDPANPAAGDLAAACAGAAGLRKAPRLLSRGTALALGESWLGAARGATHVVALGAGNTVYAGVVANGRPFEGAHGLAGAAGWLALNPVDRDDYRRIGCLEAEIASAGIVRRFVWRIKSGDMPRLNAAASGGVGTIAVDAIFEAARARDNVAESVVRDTARYIGMAIGNLAAIVDPEVVVVGGLIAEAGDLLMDAVRVEALRRVPPAMIPALQIRTALLGDDAAALGAARAASYAA